MSILNVNKINPVGGGSTITIAGIASVTNNISVGNSVTATDVIVTNVSASSSVTATTFHGSGANLTSLPAQATISNNADNRVITGGSGVALNGESNLTWDGFDLDVIRGNTSMRLTCTNSAPTLNFNANNVADAGRITLSESSGGGVMRFFTKTTGGSFAEKVRIQTEGGISFNGDTAAANALDDYEEGTWTPQVLNGWGILNPTYTENVGLYVKVGKIVHIFFRINLSGGSTNGNRLAVSGFPFTPATIGSTGYAALNGYCDSASSNAQSVFCMAGKSGTTAELFHRENTGESSFTGQELGNTGSFNFSGTYTTP